MIFAPAGFFALLIMCLSLLMVSFLTFPRYDEWPREGRTIILRLGFGMTKAGSKPVPTDYLNKIRHRDPELAKGYGQIVHPLLIQTAGGAKPQMRQHRGIVSNHPKHPQPQGFG